MAPRHNLLMKPLFPCFAAALLTLSCSKDINNAGAVREAVVKHLSERKGLDLNMRGFDIQVGALSFKANEAEADVGFMPKGSTQSVMSVHYSLEKKGSEWAVKAKAESGAGHGAAGHTRVPCPFVGPRRALCASWGPSASSLSRAEPQST